MQFWAQIHKDGLHPLHNSDSEQLSKLKLHTDYKFVVTQPRNVLFHRKFFSLLNFAFDNQEQFNNIDHLRRWVTLKAGFYEHIITPTGEMFIPESINFSSMDNLKFEEVYSKVLDVICGWLDMSNEDVMRGVVSYF